MRNLILIRHSVPEVNPDQPASAWPLSAEGRQRCVALARLVAPLAPDRVVTSREPKAVETGRLLAESLELPWNSAAHLHEHERSRVPFYERREQFEQAVERFFSTPAELVFGDETADQAHARITGAIEALLACYSNDTLAVVSHGTVLSLWLARIVGMEPWPLWQSLGLPAVAIISLPDFTLRQFIHQVK